MNALQFKNNLKLVTASYYMKQIASSNYEEDDRQHLPDFLQILQNLKKPDSSTAAQQEEPVATTSKVCSFE